MESLMGSPTLYRPECIYLILLISGVPYEITPLNLSTYANSYLNTYKDKALCYTLATHRAFHQKQIKANPRKINDSRVPTESRLNLKFIDSILKHVNRVPTLRLALFSSFSHLIFKQFFLSGGIFGKQSLH